MAGQRLNFREIGTFSTLQADIRKTMKDSDMKPAITYSRAILPPRRHPDDVIDQIFDVTFLVSFYAQVNKGYIQHAHAK